MNLPIAVMALAILLAAGAAAGEPPALNWLEANKRSAALIKQHGPSNEAADLAKAAFDLYPDQTKRYNAKVHAQLLLNLADARRKAGGRSAAMAELERGASAITRLAGEKNQVLIEVWQEAALTAGRGGPKAGEYDNRALALAEEAWGPDDPRTVDILLDVAHGLRQVDGYAATLTRYGRARERASRAGEDSLTVARIDLALARLDLENSDVPAAINGYRALIARLEKRADSSQQRILDAAYAQLEICYEKQGDTEAAAAIHRRRIAGKPSGS